MTDALDTPARRSQGGTAGWPSRRPQRATDLVLFARAYGAGDRAARAIERAIRQRRLRRSGAEASVGRVLALRSRVK